MSDAYLALETMCNFWHDYFTSKEFASFDYFTRAQIFIHWENNIKSLIVTFQSYNQLLDEEAEKIKDLVKAIRKEIF